MASFGAVFLMSQRPPPPSHSTCKQYHFNIGGVITLVGTGKSFHGCKFSITRGLCFCWCMRIVLQADVCSSRARFYRYQNWWMVGVGELFSPGKTQGICPTDSYIFHQYQRYQWRFIMWQVLGWYNYEEILLIFSHSDERLEGSTMCTHMLHLRLDVKELKKHGDKMRWKKKSTSINQHAVMLPTGDPNRCYVEWKLNWTLSLSYASLRIQVAHISELVSRHGHP